MSEAVDQPSPKGAPFPVQSPESNTPTPACTTAAAPTAPSSTLTLSEEVATPENRRKSVVQEVSFSDLKSEFLARRKRNVKVAWEEKGEESPPGNLSKTLSDELFVDKSFPPDISSLSYVYSGEDKYEKMLFKRPWEIDSDAVFTGVGGTCQWPFPWLHWRDKGWFQGAMSITSLSVKSLEKLIPGYRNFNESFQEDYFGAFLFRLWRFGRWQEVFVDDYLPLLYNNFAYCGPVGEKKEYWAALLEKAYAKCNRTYESIENGNILDALTDLTGAICEYFTPDVNPPHNLFRLLNISCFNRSLIVCWRSEKRLTPIGFIVYQSSSQTSGWKDSEDNHRYLHIVTAATKFQTTDGRMLEMVRLKCPFPAEPKWCGRFSESDKTIWETINQDFMERFQPLQNKDEDEYWLTVEDFRCNFGSMIICSSHEPFVQEGLNVSRKYNRGDQHFVTQTPQQTPQLNKTKNSCLKVRSWSLTDNYPCETTASNQTSENKAPSSESLGQRKVSPETTVSSADSSKSSLNVFQYDHSSSPIKTASPELLPSKKSPSTSPPYTGVRRKISYQPPGRSPLASEGSFDDQSSEANAVGTNSSITAERRQTRPLLRGKSASPSRELLQDCSMSHSLDSSILNRSASSKELLSPFTGGLKDARSLFNSERERERERTPPTSPKSEDSGFKIPTKQPENKTKTSRSLDEISKLQWPAKSPFASPTLRPKSISLRSPLQTKTEKSNEQDPLVSCRAMSNTSVYERSAFQSGLISCDSTIDDYSSDINQIFRQGTMTPTMTNPAMPRVDESPSSHLPSVKGQEISKIELEKVSVSASVAEVSSCQRKPDTEQKEKQRGKIIFKSCMSTDEEDEDVCSPKKSSPKTMSPKDSVDFSEKRTSTSELKSAEEVSPNRKVSGESESNPNRTPPAAPAMFIAQHNQVADGGNDFGSLVQIVKKVRLKSASSRALFASQDLTGGHSVAANRKMGRYERLALFCHSSSEGSSPAMAEPTPTSQESSTKPPGNQARKISLGAITTLSESNFLASKMDRFSPSGSWSQQVKYYGTWHKRKCEDDIEQCPRILLTIHKLEIWKTDLDPAFIGRSHVIVSLLQDYRHGSSTANSLLQPIGFKIYKTKNPEKDEKRPLGKLNLVSTETSNGVQRELVKRMNLEQGNYFIVPFCPNREHEGQFLLRVLGERNNKEDKPEWYQNILRVLTSVANSPAP